MNTEIRTITIDNIEFTYRWEDGRLTVFSYSGQPHDAIRVLMEKYLMPPKRYLEHPYHPNMPWWGAETAS